MQHMSAFISGVFMKFSRSSRSGRLSSRLLYLQYILSLSFSFSLPVFNSISWPRAFTLSVKPVRLCHNPCEPIVSLLSKWFSFLLPMGPSTSHPDLQLLLFTDSVSWHHYPPSNMTSRSKTPFMVITKVKVSLWALVISADILISELFSSLILASAPKIQYRRTSHIFLQSRFNTLYVMYLERFVF